MNRNTLEAYAQKARRDFIAAVTGRAASYGLTAKSVEPVVEEGDVARVGADAFPRTAVEARKRLEEQIRRDGFGQVMEAMAYTWFNRLAAIRYMELHGYLGHGYRVLSHPEGQSYPEILEHAADVDLPGLDREKAVELKLDGSQDEEQLDDLTELKRLFEHATTFGSLTQVWFPYNKGGEFRKWYGNQDYLVNWENDGAAIRAFGTEIVVGRRQAPHPGK